MSDKKHGPVRALVERAIVTHGATLSAYNRGEINFADLMDGDPKLIPIRAAADVMDAQPWPTGDEAAAQLARAWQNYMDIVRYGKASDAPPGRFVRDASAAVLARLAKGGAE